jgi:aminoglycoside phosphotransferase (APT) family kinase protein
VTGLQRADPFDLYRATLDALGVPSPTFEWAFRRLGASRPAPSPPAIVHGDFRLGNLMISPSGISAVLDWELVHAGDPLEDLGWVCTRTWRFGQAKPVGGLGDYGELLDAYEKASGRRVDLETLRWWEAFGSLKWGVICMMQTARHFAGKTSVELATIGRRVAEVEWDLLDVMGL